MYAVTNFFHSVNVCSLWHLFRPSLGETYYIPSHLVAPILFCPFTTVLCPIPVHPARPFIELSQSPSSLSTCPCTISNACLSFPTPSPPSPSTSHLPPLSPSPSPSLCLSLSSSPTLFPPRPLPRPRPPSSIYQSFACRPLCSAAVFVVFPSGRPTVGQATMFGLSARLVAVALLS